MFINIANLASHSRAIAKLNDTAESRCYFIFVEGKRFRKMKAYFNIVCNIFGEKLRNMRKKERGHENS